MLFRSPIAIALNTQAVAIELDFVKPFWGGRDRSAHRGQAEFERKGHVEKDRCRPRKIPIPHKNGPGAGAPRP